MKTKQVEMEAMREAELKLKRKVCYVKIQNIIVFFFLLSTVLCVIIFFKDQKKKLLLMSDMHNYIVNIIIDKR